MQKLLPSERGFTLVEILVTITIVAILAVVGMVIMGAVQRNARDAQRIADINAIAKAMESNYAARYQGLQAPWFARGTFPVDPIYRFFAGQFTCNASTTSSTCKYCVLASVPPVSGAGSVTGCYPVSPIVGNNQPPAGATFVVCANLEGSGGNACLNRRCYCKSSQQ
ncbi:hypothetical protein A3D83_04900 [Candidatus Daviesbacteria bacterium RIFCSPHIGHO2_02_FULL_41_10]|uniref:Type II secretion system protein GspG C-terminal domain-containing protein n=2 Tax=Candidatus Daviesiibacteriota TaxID=1752718 RepID=A0A1F5IST6_9BACT|nr:MAG: hypothetical protein A2871_00865 [Candidatus Daviesbacteria bacterium RIFCSPHIGHO2_01_FULL_41_23]OGE32974.1 MAG: hypothetical protein A3D83_04900 [Candidatus Daviesbacteria bacterium RIFCSPHIGHO2_02_FULL_41_10]OGE62445.1 MAG: hypothetical protein A2967_01350 [Candidatus Daviesbacteria bacterium RIFCSPLOWO2_01_FULL_41_32]